MATVTNAVTSVAGATIKMDFRVVDIIDRPRPVPPRNTARSPLSGEAFDRAMANFDRDLATMERWPLVAIGELTLVDSSSVGAVATDAAQSEINRLNGEIASLRRQLASVPKESSRASEIENSIQRLIRRRAGLAAGRKAAPERATGTDDYVYIFGDAKQFSTWRRGQQRSAPTFVERVRVKPSVDHSGRTSLELDVVCTALQGNAEDDKASKLEPATQSTR